MLKRSLLSFTAMCLVLFGSIHHTHADAPDLTIGSKAPALDIEHWIQDGNGAFKPVKKFEKGKVYIVEFWATWCAPCIMSMPHLAELQQQYRDQVQIISISTESLDKVKSLLAKEDSETGKTYAEITSAYCLTTDPDESVYHDYMTASQSNGIPNAFVVGKTGAIEWIGHPASMDDVLEQVINDSWDRKAFMEQLKQDRELQENMQRMSQLAGSGKMEEALEMVTKLIGDAPTEPIKDHWVNIRHNLKLMAKKIDEETTDYFNAQLADMQEGGNVQAMLSFGNMLFGIDQEGGQIGSLGKSTVKSLEAFDLQKMPPGYGVLYYNTIALLTELEGDFLKAAKAQEQAVENANERQKSRMEPYLKELRVKAGLDKEDPETEEDPKKQ